MRALWSILGAALGLLCAASSRAHAQEPSGAATHPLVQVQVKPCPQVSPAEVLRVVRVELGALITLDDTATDVTQVRLSCSATRGQVHVHDPITGKDLSRTIELEQTDAALRSRLLALAAAELVVASWTELETNPVPSAPVVGKVPSVQATQAARAVARAHMEKKRLEFVERTRMLAVLSRRSFFSGPDALWGGGIRLGKDQFPMVGWTADLLAEHGTIPVTLGRVSLDTFTVGGSLLLYRRWSVLTFQLGMGLRAGAVRLSGTPDSPNVAKSSSGIAPWGWPTGAAGLRINPVGPLEIELAGEIGYVVLPVSGAVFGVRELTLQGPWGGAILGLGLSL